MFVAQAGNKDPEGVRLSLWIGQRPYPHSPRNQGPKKMAEQYLKMREQQEDVVVKAEVFVAGGRYRNFCPFEKWA